jgi:nucleotide-binding universal stress UspA family protein
MHEHGAQAKARIVISERPADAILAEAEGEGVAFIAMATHGRSGLSRMLMGSVAGQVQQGTRIPLLLYRPKPGGPQLHAEPAAIAAV